MSTRFDSIVQESMTIAPQPAEDGEITLAPVIFTVSDANTQSTISPSTSPERKEDEVIWKTLPLSPPDDPIDQYYKRYATVHPPHSTLYEKNTERGRLPNYLKQMNRQTSEVPSETPSRRSVRRRSRTPKRSRFVRSFYYVGSRHSKYGLRHIVLTAIIVIAWLLGSLMFWLIEAPAEKEVVADTYVALNEAFDVIAVDLAKLSKTVNGSEMAEHVKQAYTKLLGIEGKYKWSAIYKTESAPEGTWTWTFESAFFFTFTLFTTVGYGTIAPGTDLGRFCVIWYSCIFYPFSLVVIRDLGQLILIGMTRIYARLLIKIRTVGGYLTPDWETIRCPLSIVCIVSMVFIAIMGEFFHFYDQGPEEGLNHFGAFYFSYLSYTMIGFGDLNPVNVPYSGLIAILITAGLPLMRVVTKGLVIAMENGYFGTMLFVESKLEGRREEPKTEKPVEAVETGSICDSSDEEDDEEKKRRDELMQNFTIRSLARFMSSNRDVYNGDFGRVEFRKSDL
ncbi:hypothetical protein PMAYCL1PPCAC_17315 [Pristionchus mayeri]|uniref:Potassium channel domain-containing protein n=1 Tax=Pristionchus mayeri TaxID=1317129 RepID=A0AAN5CME0_9BILA|nr:hypothetical protein PMAYCL1PPCAC_17315 [Pristionchus mayeri]